ncbi:DUF3800 domain-containing protein [Actinoplanes sp. NPDC051859]|uniref:DUF3800 domain-containing protein n=1 Tax=Actinoplanes sp. NPDC051859 TaxID=3363909 RepID=UPI0037AAA376
MSDCSSFRLYYLDDSGAHHTGYSTFTWLQFDSCQWDIAQLSWLRHREHLHQRYGIPPDAVLHATDLDGSRPAATAIPGFDRARHGAAVIHDSLKTIARLPGLSVGTVYRRHRPYLVGGTKHALYSALVRYLDNDLRAYGARGMIFLDGDRDPTAVTAHQTLAGVADRRLIEEPQARRAEHDQWVQMADLAAWSAYQGLARRSSKQHAWHWYPQLFGALDRHGGPIEL